MCSVEVSFTNDSYAPYEFEWIVNGQTFYSEVPVDQTFTQGDTIVFYDVLLTATNLWRGSDYS